MIRYFIICLVTADFHIYLSHWVSYTSTLMGKSCEITHSIAVLVSAFVR